MLKLLKRKEKPYHPGVLQMTKLSFESEASISHWYTDPKASLWEFLG